MYNMCIYHLTMALLFETYSVPYFTTSLLHMHSAVLEMQLTL